MNMQILFSISSSTFPGGSSRIMATCVNYDRPRVFTTMAFSSFDSSSGERIIFSRPNPSKFDGLGRGFDGVGVALCWHRTWWCRALALKGYTCLACNIPPMTDIILQYSPYLFIPPMTCHWYNLDYSLNYLFIPLWPVTDIILIMLLHDLSDLPISFTSCRGRADVFLKIPWMISST